MISLREERKLWKKGYKMVACLDEAGRGPLAGPVIACAAVIFQGPNSKFLVPKIQDPKKISCSRREELYKVLTKNPGIEWGVGRVSEKIIDKINILEATKLAMEKAVKKLKKKPDFLILDGNFGVYLPIPQKSIIKADEKVFSCVAASIIAKVTRDRIMGRYHKKFPCYGFDRHKGYPTEHHQKMLKKYGKCDIHRNSFHYGRTKTKTYQIKKRQKKGKHLH